MSKQYLYLPGVDLDWEVWTVHASSNSKPVHLERKLPDAMLGSHVSGQVAVALPISQCLVLPIWLPAAEASLFRQMIQAQLEKRGLPTRNGLVFDYSILSRVGDRALVGVTVLPSDFPDALCVPKAQCYTSSAAVLPLPENQIVIWEERNHIVLAITRGGGEPVYSQVIARQATGFEFTPETVREIRALHLALNLEQAVESLVGITLWGDWPGAAACLDCLALPVATGTRPSPDENRVSRVMESSALLPLPLQTERKVQSRRDRNLYYLFGAVALYILLAIALTVHLHTVRAKADKMREAVSRDKPVADKLAKGVASWRALEPAIDPRLYPIEQFYQCSNELPAAGVRIDLFETQGTTIKINGTARNAPTVFRFVDRLKKNKSLSDYQWKLGQQKLQKDDTAVFKLEGTLRYGPAK